MYADAGMERSCCLPIVGVTPSAFVAGVRTRFAHRLERTGVFGGLERLTPGAAINGQWAVAKPRTALRLAFLFTSAVAVAVACHSFHLFYFVLRDLKLISFIGMLIVYYYYLLLILFAVKHE